MATFTDLRRVIDSEVDQVTGPYTCYVVNADSAYPCPRKFTYRGCSFPKNSKVLCARSIEGHSEMCKHNPLAPGNHTHFYRFDVLLIDGNASSKPLYATVFESGQKLLNMAANEFALLDHSQQVALLQKATFQAPLVNVWIRTNGIGTVIVNRLQNAISLDSPEHSDYHTPSLQHVSRFHSPRSQRGSSVGASSSAPSACRGIVKQDEADGENWKRLLAAAMEILSNLSTRDT